MFHRQSSLVSLQVADEVDLDPIEICQLPALPGRILWSVLSEFPDSQVVEDSHDS